jgi:hypothetical protein
MQSSPLTRGQQLHHLCRNAAPLAGAVEVRHLQPQVAAQRRLDQLLLGWDGQQLSDAGARDRCGRGSQR